MNNFMTAHYNVTMSVVAGLEIVDSCNHSPIYHSRHLVVTLTSDPSDFPRQLSDFLHCITICAMDNNKQKLAVHSNGMLLSHSSYVMRTSHSDYDLYYPYLNLTVSRR